MSPGLSQTGGSVFAPFLTGVPVEIMSPGFERHERRDVNDDVGEREDHVRRGVVLRDLAVLAHGQVQRLGQVDVGCDPRADAAGGVEILTLGDVEFAVADPVADRAFVAQRHPGDDAERMILRHMLAFAADDDREFAFVIEFLGNFRPDEIQPWPTSEFGAR